MNHPRKVPIARILVRGLRRRCPQCGAGRLFRGWYNLEEKCPHCELRYESDEGNTWWFMYISTALMTGVIIVGMLLVRPSNLWLGRVGVLIAAIVLIALTLPARKGLAVAIDYVMELAGGREGLAFRSAETRGRDKD